MAANRGTHAWLELGRRLIEAEEVGEDLVIRRRAMAAETGVTEAMLRRYANRTRFVEMLAASGRNLPADKLAVSFTAIEIIERIRGHDETAGDLALEDLIEGRVKVAELRRRMDDLIRPRPDMPVLATIVPRASAAALERSARRQVFQDVVEGMLTELSGPGFTIGAGVSTATVRCELVALGPRSSDNNQAWDGFSSAFLPGRPTKSALHDVISSCVMSGGFFRRYYLVFLPGTERDTWEGAAMALDFVGAANVGVVAWVWADGTEGRQARPSVVRPVIGSPVPDRRELMAQLIAESRSTQLVRDEG